MTIEQKKSFKYLKIKLRRNEYMTHTEFQELQELFKIDFEEIEKKANILRVLCIAIYIISLLLYLTQL